MPADYQIIDSGSAFASSTFPYARSFIAHSANQAPYLVMWVKTGYSSSSSAASVRVNGTEIDRIWPRPWLSHAFVDDEAVSFFFSPSLLLPPFVPFALLEIVPKPAPADYVLLSHVTYHWRT
jgi:hypothetical protein